MHQKHFQCRGTELDLSQCASYGVTSQQQDQGVGISCFGMLYFMWNGYVNY